MKKSMNNISTVLSTIFVIAGFLLANATIYSQDKGTAKGGGQKLIQAKPLNTAVEAGKLKEGDTVVSACARCKMMNYTRVNETAKGGNLGRTNEAETCPSCDVKLSGNTAKHICKMCGGEMMCCVIPAQRSEAAQTR